MTFPVRWVGSHFKKSGTVAALEQRAKRATVKTAAKREKAAARAVVSGCRWPRFDHMTPRHVCVGPIEAAHQIAIGMGGDKNGTRTNRRALMAVCSWIHQSENGIERHGRKWEALTPLGTLGPVSFWKREPLESKPGEWGHWTLVAVESSPGILDRKRGKR